MGSSTLCLDDHAPAAEAFQQLNVKSPQHDSTGTGGSGMGGSAPGDSSGEFVTTGNATILSPIVEWFVFFKQLTVYIDGAEIPRVVLPLHSFKEVTDLFVFLKQHQPGFRAFIDSADRSMPPHSELKGDLPWMISATKNFPPTRGKRDGSPWVKEDSGAAAKIERNRMDRTADFSEEEGRGSSQ
jgi:hypothetical protein